MSDAMAQGLLDMMIAKDNGLDNGIARTPQNAIDTPTTFRQWCEGTLKPACRPAENDAMRLRSCPRRLTADGHERRSSTPLSLEVC